MKSMNVFMRSDVLVSEEQFAVLFDWYKQLETNNYRIS